MVTVKDLLVWTLQDHRALNPGEPHGAERCSDCMLLTVLAIVAKTAGVLELEAAPLVPAVPEVNHG